MEITVHLPDDIAQHENAGREVLEAFVVEGYRKGSVTALQGAQLLDMARPEFLDFLGAHLVDMYSVERLRDEFQMVMTATARDTSQR